MAARKRETFRNALVKLIKKEMMDGLRSFVQGLPSG